MLDERFSRKYETEQSHFFASLRTIPFFWESSSSVAITSCTDSSISFTVQFFTLRSDSRSPGVLIFNEVCGKVFETVLTEDVFEISFGVFFGVVDVLEIRVYGDCLSE